ncbi:hypothetical protein DCAR_0312426 [Daucus carota subsp. sativus]|uniref:Uncharacterized protein n=1 Tax=Daucus carota subsp. sativus TaxID=79200 RepID=A0A166B0G5_DAUCS|nr:hypothetical protein DCAR_0312426 [Daucus carota subsp. sativus]
MGVADQCKNTFLELQWKKVHRYVILMIAEKKNEVVVEKTGGPAESYDNFTSTLPENDCRYAVYDYDYMTSEKCQKSKILSWHEGKRTITMGYSVRRTEMYCVVFHAAISSHGSTAIKRLQETCFCAGDRQNCHTDGPGSGICICACTISDFIGIQQGIYKRNAPEKR